MLINLFLKLQQYEILRILISFILLLPTNLFFNSKYDGFPVCWSIILYLHELIINIKI